MKITTEDGQDMEATRIILRYTDKHGNKIQDFDASEDLYTLKPVKKTEDKKKFYLAFHSFSMIGYEIDEEYDLTPTTANKLSEAISALVEFVTGYGEESELAVMAGKARAAHKSYKESQ